MDGKEVLIEQVLPRGGSEAGVDGIWQWEKVAIRLVHVVSELDQQLEQP
jgi:hypothetical protein